MRLETKIEMFGNPSSEFFISDLELQKLLSKDFDRHAEFWNFSGPGLETFARKIAKLFVVSNGGFTFQATWSGSETSRVESLSIKEFIEIIKNNRVGTQTKYVVVGSV